MIPGLPVMHYYCEFEFYKKRYPGWSDDISNKLSVAGPFFTKEIADRIAQDFNGIDWIARKQPEFELSDIDYNQKHDCYYYFDPMEHDPNIQDQHCEWPGFDAQDPYGNLLHLYHMGEFDWYYKLIQSTFLKS